MALPRRQKGPPLIDKHHPAFLVQTVTQFARKVSAWFRSKKHRDYVGTLPCRGCGRTQFVAAAHLRIGTDGATGERPSDFYTNPLCDGYLSNWTIVGCHDKQHRAELTFWRPLGGVEIAKQEALAIALNSPCDLTRKAAAAVIEGKDWRDAV